MNYQRIYDEIIENRKQNIPECYSEKHHIVPKSLGGTNKKDNIVKLTAREHFICHLLLTKIYKEGTYEWAKMISAFCRMLQQPQEEQKRYCPSKWYAYLRENMSIAMSINQGGERNSQYGKHWIVNPETGEKKSLHESEIQTYLDNGWIRGRTLKPKRQRLPRKEKQKVQKQYNKKQREIHGRRYLFTNKLTGEIKQLFLDEIGSLDDNWESPFYILDHNKDNIKRQLICGKSIQDISVEFNIGYHNVYSWYRKYGRDIKEELDKIKYNKNVRICKYCGKEFYHKSNRDFCSKQCWKESCKNLIWVKKDDTIKHIKRLEFPQYLQDGWRELRPVPNKPSSEWKVI